MVKCRKSISCSWSDLWARLFQEHRNKMAHFLRWRMRSKDQRWYIRQTRELPVLSIGQSQPQPHSKLVTNIWLVSDIKIIFHRLENSRGRLETIERLQNQLIRKDNLLTESRLEALGSAHQLHSLRDTVSKLRSETSLLQEENEKLFRKEYLLVCHHQNHHPRRSIKRNCQSKFWLWELQAPP